MTTGKSIVKRVAATLVPPIAIDRHGVTPMYRQIYEWFQSAIVDRRMRPGARIPSSRGLAAELGVSRLPVVNAYQQLYAEGYFRNSPASARVSRGLSQPNPSRSNEHGRRRSSGQAATAAPRRVARRAALVNKSPVRPWLSALGAFRLSVPALDHFPVRIWTKPMARHSRAASRTMLAYGDPMGYGPLRETIAEYVRTVRGVRCEASQILVTTGSQQALQIASQLLVDPKDRVCMEDPGYPGAWQAFAMAGFATIIPIRPTPKVSSSLISH